MPRAVFKLHFVCQALKRETNGSLQPLVYCLPHEREQEVHKCIHPKHFRVSDIKSGNVVTRNFQNIAADTVALTETSKKFSQSLRGLIHRCKI